MLFRGYLLVNRLSHGRPQQRIGCMLSIVLLACLASTVDAEQFVLFDQTFTYTKHDADNSQPSKSHFYVKDEMLNPQRPKDWTSPVDYRNGSVHIRLEVLEKPPGGAPTTWSLCYIPNRGQKNGDGCTCLRARCVHEVVLAE